MLSSTSSSNDRLPSGPWLRNGVISAALFFVMLGSWELLWRTRGFVTSVTDDDARWVAILHQLERSTTVLIGSSRIQTDIDPDLWAVSSDNARPLQLGLASGSFLPLLEHLANDDQFAGTVIVDFIPLMVFDATGTPDRPTSEMLLAYRTALTSPAKMTEAILRSAISGRFVYQSPALSFTMVVHATIRREWPQPIAGQMRRNRWTAFDFQIVDSEQRIRGLYEYDASHGQPMNASERDATIDRITVATARILERGGRIVFVQFPRSHSIRDIEELRYPREKYWDVFSRAVRAPTFAVEDYSSLAWFRCPDGSHLDFRDVPAFMLALRAVVEGEQGK